MSINGADVDAGIGIGRFLLNAATRDFRRGKIKQAILCIDKDIQTYIGQVSTTNGKESVSNQPETGGLIALTQKAYINGTLEIEKEQIETYVTDYINVITPSSQTDALAFLKLDEDYNKATNALVFLKLDENYNKAMDSLINRREAAQKYIGILTEIAKLHATLKENFQGKGEDRLSDIQLQDYCKNIYTSKAEKVVISNDEVKEVGKIVSKYTKSLDTLIQDMDKSF